MVRDKETDPLLTEKKTRQARDGTVKDKTAQLLSIHLLIKHTFIITVTLISTFSLADLKESFN